ncbi:hypothetical protein ACFOSV_09800 [Algoriphagus namhaensis]|uniref:DUF481 domain-containing protein n=1 Tax=Algoriphagus namhaensis TaxID=915353 RepID=A0ABV8AU26_9BACT
MRNASFELKKLIIVLIAFLLSTLNSFAQHKQPPIPFEIFFGNEAVFSQLIINRDFSPESKFSLFSLTTYTSGYNQDGYENDLALINQITYDLGKGFGFMGGINVNAAVGLTPVIGPKHVYASRKFLAVSILSYSVDGKHDLSFFGSYEFKPPLNRNLSLYTRFQALLNESIGESRHNRSFMYLRIGLKKRNLNYGLGANLDQYGPDKNFTDNYGLFIGWDF